MRSTLRQKFEQERSRLKAQIDQLTQELEQKHLTVQELDKQLEQKRSMVTDLESQIAELERSKKATSIVQYDVLNAVNAEKLNEKQQALNALLNFYRSNPTATLAEAGEVIERSKGTVSNYLNELEQAGLIRRNGQGVKVTQ
jgi:predicted transcriptional regulator